MASENRSVIVEALPSIVRRQAKASPDKVLVRTVTGESASWSELDSSMEQWAVRFLALGVRRGDVVATLLDAGLDALAIWLGLSSIGAIDAATNRSEEHTSELQSLMRISYAVFCLKKKKK